MASSRRNNSSSSGSSSGRKPSSSSGSSSSSSSSASSRPSGNGYVEDTKVTNAARGTETQKTSGEAGGYGNGSGYANRETAFTWSDGSTTYSNATNWADAQREGNKQGLNLVSAVSYGSSGEQKKQGGNSSSGISYAANPGAMAQTGFTNNIYSKDKETGKNYTNALAYEQQTADLYKNGSELSGNPYGGTGYQAAANGNPYGDILSYVQRQYDDFEDQIIDLNRQSIRQGTDRLENQKGTVSKNYEENARQAYINYLQQQHALPEILSAQGITGGATETAQLSLQNTYQGSLSEINNALAQAINDIDNSIYELERSGNIEMARQVLANSQAALGAYQNIMQNYIDYNYQASRDQLSDQRYNNEYADKLKQYEQSQTKYENTMKKEEYDRVLELINKGFTVNNAADILGVDQSELNNYISYLNQSRQLDIEKQEAAIAKTLSTIKPTGGSSAKGKSSSAGKSSSQQTAVPSAYRNTSRSAYIPLSDASGFASSYGKNGVTIPGYGTMSLQEAVALYNEGKGPIRAYVNPGDNRIYFSA